MSGCVGGLKLGDVRAGQTQVIQDFTLDAFDHRARAMDQQSKVFARGGRTHLLEHSLEMGDLRLGSSELAVIPNHRSVYSDSRVKQAGRIRCGQAG